MDVCVCTTIMHIVLRYVILFVTKQNHECLHKVPNIQFTKIESLHVYTWGSPWTSPKLIQVPNKRSHYKNRITQINHYWICSQNVCTTIMHIVLRYVILFITKQNHECLHKVPNIQFTKIESLHVYTWGSPWTSPKLIQVPNKRSHYKNRITQINHYWICSQNVCLGLYLFFAWTFISIPCSC